MGTHVRLDKAGAAAIDQDAFAITARPVSIYSRDAIDKQFGDAIRCLWPALLHILFILTVSDKLLGEFLKTLQSERNVD